VPDDSRMKTEFVVHLDGNRLQPEEAAAILGIRVFQTRSGASAFEVVVADPELKWQGKPTFTECREVKIELGTVGKLKPVFDGEVTAWRTELERSGPSVLVLRGLDRSHRLMRAKKTKTYANATPSECAKQIAADYGLTAKTRPGSPTPVKMFRFQANQTDFEFLRAMAELEGYVFFIDGSDLHFERPQIPSTDDVEFTFGEDVKTFLPKANFRKPAGAVEVVAWDTSGKSELTGKAKTGDELWSVPGVKPGSKLAKFTSSKPEMSLVESQVGTQEHADTVAKAALTRRAMEFITAEVEVQGNPVVKPGALVNIKKVGPYSGHYLVTEANHFYDAAGYNCVFYVARDKWGNSSQTQQQAAAARQQAAAAKQQAAQARAKQSQGAAARKATGAAAGAAAKTTSQAGSNDFEGVLEGDYGPLRHWPFYLVRNGTPLEPSDLASVNTSNVFEHGAWHSDADGAFKFDGLDGEGITVDILFGEVSVADEGSDVFEGSLEGPYGPLRNWPFLLLSDGKLVGPDDLGGATTANEFIDGAWRSDADGDFRFEGLGEAAWDIEILGPGQ
jgi:phage protein D